MKSKRVQALVLAAAVAAGYAGAAAYSAWAHAVGRRSPPTSVRATA